MDLLQARREPAPRGLAALTRLFQCLHAEDVPYCHWKSNDHLAASMTGATDLDLLVQRKAARRFARILEDTGFKRLAGKPGRGYPGIEDYVGFDAASGRLLHLDIHYQLTVGEKVLKGYRLPWEELLLSTRQLDEEHGIYVADPHMELLIVVIRAVMKLRTRDLVFTALGRPYTARSALQELPWLTVRVGRERLLSVAGRLVGPSAAQILTEVLAAPRPTVTQLLAFARSARPRLSEYRMYGPLEARLRRWIGEWRAVWGALDSMIRGRLDRGKRTPQGGLIVAFVGAAGAGKSSLTRALATWLSREVALLATYGGSASGGQALVPVLRARKRHQRAVRALRARNRGLIVIWDQWPQNQVAGLTDGPQLARWRGHRSPLLRTAADYELATLQAAELNPPDLVLRLQVSPGVALQRKPGMPADQLRRETEIVRRLQYPAGTRIVDIDADQPFEEVLLRVKQAVWEAI
jgi:thymidylate kinase